MTIVYAMPQTRVCFSCIRAHSEHGSGSLANLGNVAQRLRTENHDVLRTSIESKNWQTAGAVPSFRPSAYAS